MTKTYDMNDADIAKLMPVLLAHMDDNSEDYICSKAHVLSMLDMDETSSPELPGGMSVGSKGYKIASRVFTSHLP
ncbi:hypothetical protein I3271_00945 [Photobacterium leiognathi]|uniref:hypothetical protein n=1 Tax=Photobacterium leiognathi TaxID=553611 RepID=UPI001EDCA731|nr:hypothetical protein [Photobacterium leiognathi]MCG3883249.1 hypothetical protein [Photobacterium leiognathi]